MPLMTLMAVKCNETKGSLFVFEIIHAAGDVLHARLRVEQAQVQVGLQQVRQGLQHQGVLQVLQRGNT